VLLQFIESLVEGQAAAAQAKAAQEANGVAAHGVVISAPADDADNGGVRLFTRQQLAGETMPEDTSGETMPEDTSKLPDVNPGEYHVAHAATNGAGAAGTTAAAEASVALESSNGTDNGGSDVAATNGKRGMHDEGARAQPEEEEQAAAAGEVSVVARERRRGGMQEAESERVQAALGILRGGLINSAASRNGRGGTSARSGGDT
jgi:hypothetical protein